MTITNTDNTALVAAAEEMADALKHLDLKATDAIEWLSVLRGPSAGKAVHIHAMRGVQLNARYALTRANSILKGQ
jgi:hypothetical protein